MLARRGLISRAVVQLPKITKPNAAFLAAKFRFSSVSKYDPSLVRNVAIIAHVDHGRLYVTKLHQYDSTCYG